MGIIDKGVEILVRSSGITELQAKTCIYYAIATYLDVDIMPALMIMGNSGTGKSSLLRQLSYFVKGGLWANAKTPAALREKLAIARNVCALIEEGDGIDEDLILCRYSRETAEIETRREVEQGWKNLTIDIFGSTVLHRRKPPADIALRNRSIFIKTQLRPGEYKLDKTVYREEIRDIAEGIIPNADVTSERVGDTWRPLVIIAKQLGDTDWLAYAEVQMQLDRDAFLVGQDYEPQPALEHALKALLDKRVSVPLKEVKEHLDKNFDLRLKIYQISEMIGDVPDYKTAWVNNVQEVRKVKSAEKGGF